MRSTPPVAIRIALLYLIPLGVCEFVPIKSIQLFAGVCAVKRRNPELWVVFTPLTSFADWAKFGISNAGFIAPDNNLMRGLSVREVAALLICVVPLMSSTDFTDACVVLSTKFIPTPTRPLKFARPNTETSPSEFITIELLCVPPLPVWNVMKFGAVIPNPPDESCNPSVVDVVVRTPR